MTSLWRAGLSIATVGEHIGRGRIWNLKGWQSIMFAMIPPPTYVITSITTIRWTWDVPGVKKVEHGLSCLLSFPSVLDISCCWNNNVMVVRMWTWRAGSQFVHTKFQRWLENHSQSWSPKFRWTKLSVDKDGSHPFVWNGSNSYSVVVYTYIQYMDC